MPKIAIHGEVKGSQFKADYPSLFRDAFKQYEGRVVTVTISPFKKPRSNQQNRYLHGIVYPLIASETGNTQEAVAEAMKSMFLPPRFVLDVAVVGTTTELSTAEFNEYVEKICAWASEYGIIIPQPNEVER